MKFLVDICIGQSAGNWLVQRGYDVNAVSEHDCRMSDLDILTWAYK